MSRIQANPLRTVSTGDASKSPNQRPQLTSSIDAGGLLCALQHDEGDLYIAPTVLDFGSDVDAFESSAVMQGEVGAPPSFSSSVVGCVLPAARLRTAACLSVCVSVC